MQLESAGNVVESGKGLKIVLAPDSFKGSISAAQAAEAMATGIRRFFPEAVLVQIPMSDGGEGLVETLVPSAGTRSAASSAGRIVFEEVTGPLGQKVQAFYGLLDDGQTAVIEMAAASGLTLVPPAQRNPLVTTTFGTGELILAAARAGCRRLILGIGGSATNDGGVGMAQALGIKFLDENGKEIGWGGKELARIARIDTSGLAPQLQGIQIEVACDVNNPLTGPHGAAAVYGPQKGATPAMVQELDAALHHLAEVIKRDLGKDVAEIPGAGAAGGLGAGLMAFLNARLRPGMELVLEQTRFRERAAGAHLVITGEGKMDGQTLFGKVPCGVAKVSRELGIPVVAIAGCLGEGATTLHQCGIDALFSLTSGPMTLEEAMAQAADLLAQTAGQVVRLFVRSRRRSD